MIDPLSSNPIRPSGPLTPPGQGGPAQTTGSSEKDFAALLRQQLEQVSRVQQEAEAGVQDLLTGRSTNITEVFVAARKAEVAFSLMMELRNKLVGAYEEMKQLRV